MNLSVAQVQETLRLQHIVITDVPLEQVVPTTGPVAFDEAGLRQLRNLESPIIFQGIFLAICNKSAHTTAVSFRSVHPCEQRPFGSDVHRNLGPRTCQFARRLGSNREFIIVPSTTQRSRPNRLQQRCGSMAGHRRSPLL